MYLKVFNVNFTQNPAKPECVFFPSCQHQFKFSFTSFAQCLLNLGSEQQFPHLSASLFHTEPNKALNPLGQKMTHFGIAKKRRKKKNKGCFV